MKLTYFNVRGLAETSRILLALGKEEYEDFRYPLNVIDMSKFKMEKEEFDKDKTDGKLVKSLNKVPFLEVDGTIIPQSKSIERFLAKRFNMMGETDLEAAKIDSLCEYVRDFKDLYQKVRASEDKETAMNQWFTVTLVEKLKLLEEILGDNDGFSVGDKLTLSDVVLFTFITHFFDNKEASLNATLVAPKLRKIIDRVKELPEVVKWLNNRPITDF
jgi:prostaglandin-H2 D-isomerase / glutathione transferase